MENSDIVGVKAIEGVQLRVPATWKRSALVVLSTGETEERTVTVALRRETLDPRLTLMEYTDNLLIEFARTIPKFALLRRSTRVFGRHTAGELTYTLTLKGREYEQSTINVLDRPGSVLSIITSAPQASLEEHRSVLDGIVASVVLDPERYGSDT